MVYNQREKAKIEFTFGTGSDPSISMSIEQKNE